MPYDYEELRQRIPRELDRIAMGLRDIKDALDRGEIGSYAKEFILAGAIAKVSEASAHAADAFDDLYGRAQHEVQAAEGSRESLLMDRDALLYTIALLRRPRGAQSKVRRAMAEAVEFLEGAQACEARVEALWAEMARLEEEGG
jgi:hypothetical protein